MSVEFAVAKWEQELIDSAKITKSVQLDKVPCDWCYAPATWKINDDLGAYQGYANACTAHGTEWYPEAFPKSRAATVWQTERVSPVGVKATVQRPWYPLQGHRSGLRANDLVSLASALFILSLEGGTAH